MESPGYVTYTYSAKGYQELLEQAGFEDNLFYWVWPNYNRPVYASRMNNFEELEYILKNLRKSRAEMSEKGRLMLGLGLCIPEPILSLVYRFFLPGFLIFAYKGRKGKTLENEILNRLPDITGFVRAGGGKSPSSKVIYLLFRGREPAFLVRVPRFPESIDLLAKEERTVEKFAGISVKSENVDGSKIFIEEFIHADSFDVLNLSHNQRALEWLMRFQKPARRGPVSLVDFGFALDELVDFGCETFRERDLGALDFSRIRVVPSVREHGDFWKGNILVGEQKVYVVDWENYREIGHPLFDFCFFVICNCSIGPNHQQSFESNLLGHGKYSSILRDALDTFSEYTAFGRDEILCGIHYALLRCLHRYFLGGDYEPYKRFQQLTETWNSLLENNQIAESSIWSQRFLVRNE